MHYYIYPKGRIGKTLGKMFEFLEMHDSYSFVDDCQEGITLNEQACDIKNKIKNGEAKVVIALSQGIVITTQRAPPPSKNQTPGHQLPPRTPTRVHTHPIPSPLKIPPPPRGGGAIDRHCFVWFG